MIKGKYIHIPEFEKLKNKRVKVIILAEGIETELSSQNQLDKNHIQTLVQQLRANGISENTLRQLQQQPINRLSLYHHSNFKI